MPQRDNANIIKLSVDMGYVRKGMDSIEAKIDLLSDKKADKIDLEEVRKDVRALMMWRYYSTGAAAGIGALFAIIVEYFKSNAR